MLKCFGKSPDILLLRQLQQPLFFMKALFPIRKQFLMSHLLGVILTYLT